MADSITADWRGLVPFIRIGGRVIEEIINACKEEGEFYAFLIGSVEYPDFYDGPVITIKRIDAGELDKVNNCLSPGPVQDNEIIIVFSLDQSLPEPNKDIKTSVSTFSEQMTDVKNFNVNNYFQICCYGVYKDRLTLRFEMVAPHASITLFPVGDDLKSVPLKGPQASYNIEQTSEGEIARVSGVSGTNDPQLFSLCFSLLLSIRQPIQVGIDGRLYQMSSSFNNEYKPLHALLFSEGESVCANFTSFGTMQKRQKNPEEIQSSEIINFLKKTDERLASFESQIKSIKEEIRSAVSSEVRAALDEFMKSQIIHHEFEGSETPKIIMKGRAPQVNVKRTPAQMPKARSSPEPEPITEVTPTQKPDPIPPKTVPREEESSTHREPRSMKTSKAEQPFESPYFKEEKSATQIAPIESVSSQNIRSPAAKSPSSSQQKAPNNPQNEPSERQTKRSRDSYNSFLKDSDGSLLPSMSGTRTFEDHSATRSKKSEDRSGASPRNSTEPSFVLDEPSMSSKNFLNKIGLKDHQFY